MNTIGTTTAEIMSAHDSLAKLQRWIRRSGRKYVNGEIDMSESSLALKTARLVLRRVARGRERAEKVEVLGGE